jgi:hypothetical protein
MRSQNIELKHLNKLNCAATPSKQGPRNSLFCQKGRLAKIWRPLGNRGLEPCENFADAVEYEINHVHILGISSTSERSQATAGRI